MRFDEIVRIIDKYSLIGREPAFKTYILSLLKEDSLEINKEIKVEYNGFDGYAPNGLFNIDGSTIIDINFNLNEKTVLRLKDRFIKAINQEVPFINYLVVSNIDLRIQTDKILNRIINSLPTNNIKILFYGPAEINKIINRQQAKSKEIVNNLFTIRIKHVVEQSSNWKDTREKRIHELINKYKRGQMSLFLGAGVSASAGMVDWKTLLDSLFVNLISTVMNEKNEFKEKDVLQISQRLSKIQDGSSLALARYLRTGFSKDEDGDKKFIEAVRSSLYDLRNNELSIDSALFNSIAKLCMPERTGSKIRSVVTYNFDDLLEKCLIKKSVRHHSIYADTNEYSLDELPIYHVHGFLPEDVSGYDSLEKNTFVFSEEGYHKIYSDPYHWSNLIQLNSLREFNCVLIGLSMTDPNLRRLLDLAVKNPEGPRHFVFMKRSDSESFIYDTIKTQTDDIETTNKVQVIDNDNAARSFIESHHNLQEEIFRELGVSIIWYETYDEIPILLTNIYEKASIENNPSWLKK